MLYERESCAYAYAGEQFRIPGSIFLLTNITIVSVYSQLGTEHQSSPITESHLSSRFMGANDLWKR